jgi:hypothetical protein
MMPQLSRAQKWGLAITLCVALVFVRAWFFIAYEESYFDSDQAVIGLMAKHLADGRAWPLFFYGQEYMLAVEAWVAAPFIKLFGTSVASLRLALVAMNIAAGLLLLWLLVRDAGLGIGAAAAAASLFWIAPIATGSELVDAQGGNIEPFVWILLAWVLRRRPLALGICLGVGFLNREFSIYAAPMLVLLDLIERRRQLRPLILDWLSTAVAFLIVFTGVQLLKPHADLLGPGSAGVAVEMSGQDNFALLLQRVHWNPSEIGGRLSQLIVEYIPTLLGFQDFNPSIVAIGTDVRAGSHIVTPAVVLLMVAATTLLLLDARRFDWRSRDWQFPVYLLGVGIIAGIAYAVTRPLSVYTIRYGLLIVYGAVGLAALMLHPARRRALRAIVAALVVLYGAASLTDYARVLARAPERPPATPMRDIERRLAARGIEIGFADYWRAYFVTFLSDERIKIASIDFQRIIEYRQLAGRQVEGKGREGVIIQKEPCTSGGERVSGYYICDWK